MQPWHSILLIIITITVFGAGFYYDQIKKNTAFAYEGSFIENSNSTASSSENNHTAPLKNSDSLQQSSAWAVTKFIIQVPESSVRGSYLHKEAMKGNTFLSKILIALKENPTAMEMIYSPFQNDIFIESETEIMRSLYSVVPEYEKQKQLLLTVRGHSRKASEILAKLIIETYKFEIKTETSVLPLLPKLLKQRENILILEKRELELAQRIQDENEGSSGETIEDIALRSEIMQISTEINSHVDALKNIEQIHKKKEDPANYLSIYSLARYGNIQEILSNIDQLKRMLTNQDLEPILKNEVNKNLLKLSSALDLELAKGIEHIKELSRTALNRKILLQKRLVDMEIKRNDIHSLHPHFKLLKSVKKELGQSKDKFSIDYKKWQDAKQGLNFKKAS